MGLHIIVISTVCEAIVVVGGRTEIGGDAATIPIEIIGVGTVGNKSFDEPYIVRTMLHLASGGD